MKNILTLLFLFCVAQLATAQKSYLANGPMLGYSEMKEVLLWVQTNQAADVYFEYFEKGADRPEKLTTKTIRTHADDAFIAKIVADKVQPSKSYRYDFPPNFKVALGSCAYVNEPDVDRPGKPYGKDYNIFTSIHQKQPDMMLWLGDNSYLREVDWYTTTGILHRYTHSRAIPQLQPLLASTHHYAIWDDHDYGPNDSDRTYIHKKKTEKAFQLFWGNPTYGIDDNGGITSRFEWNDVDFFLIDNRYFRSPNNCKTCEKTILGKAQLDWLVEALTTSRAPFKVIAVGGQVLSTFEKWENHINLAPEERAYLLSKIEQESIKNVIFVTGDRHHTELSAYRNAAGYMVYDFTVSPLTSGAGKRDEINRLRVDSTMVANQNNFGLMEFSGKRTERKVELSIYDVAGNEIWRKEIESEK